MQVQVRVQVQVPLTLPKIPTSTLNLNLNREPTAGTRPQAVFVLFSVEPSRAAV